MNKESRNIQSTKDMNDIAKGTIDIANDITRILKNKVYDYSNQIHQLSELLYDGLIIIDENGVIINCNTSCAEIFDIDKKDIINQKINVIFDIKDNIDLSYIDKLYHLVIDKNPNPYQSIKGIKKDNKIYIDVSMAKIIKSDSSYYYLCLIRDNTERTIKEKILKEFFNSELNSTVIDENLNVIFSSTEFVNEYGDIDTIINLFTKEEIDNILNFENYSFQKDNNNIVSTKIVTINSKKVILFSIKKALN